MPKCQKIKRCSGTNEVNWDWVGSSGWNPATGKVETLSVGGEFPKVGDKDLSKK